MKILHDLLSGKMNVRKWIVWVFAVVTAVLLAVPVLRASWAVADAVISVAEYAKANPETVFQE